MGIGPLGVLHLNPISLQIKWSARVDIFDVRKMAYVNMINLEISLDYSECEVSHFIFDDMNISTRAICE